jgi:bifunctional non-homologous end joining protein LigD
LEGVKFPDGCVLPGGRSRKVDYVLRTVADRTPRPPAHVPLTNQDKVFYPRAKFTKGDVVRYYRDVAPYILPHLKDRPVTLIRFPDGIHGGHFYEKNAPRFTPDWVKRCAVPRQHSGGAINYIVVSNAATLVWCANLAAIELHPFLHRVPRIERPTSVAFDLDPGDGADLLDCIEVAFLIRALLDELGLQAFPKVTGSKGLQVYVPLNTPITYDVTGPFAKAVAELLEQRHPDRVVSKMAKVLRRGRVMMEPEQHFEDDGVRVFAAGQARGALRFDASRVEGAATGAEARPPR